MAETKKRAKFGLAYKVTLLIIILVALIMAVVSYFSIYQEGRVKVHEMDKRMTDVANMVAALKLIEPLAGQTVDWPVFREFIKVIRNMDPNILSVAIVSNDGEVRAFTLNPETARSLDPALSGVEETSAGLNLLNQHRFPAGSTARVSGDIVVENTRFATVTLRFSLMSLKREIMLARVRNILLTLLMMIVGFFGALLLAKTVTKPIEELTRAMAKVAKGDLNVVTHAQSRDEIGLLTESFNLMLQDLKEKVRIQGAFDVVADELKEVGKIKESFQLYVCKEAQERYVDASVLALQDGDGARQPVTVLFADLSQLALNATTQDAANLAGALETYFRRFMATVFEYEGQVYKFAENLFMVVFGIPHPHQDDDRRAILTAVNMQKALAEINKGRIARHETPLFISMGVTSAEASGSLLTKRGLTAAEVIRDYLGFTLKMSSQPISL